MASRRSSCSLRSLLEGMVETAALPEITLSGLALDSRRLRPGDGFVALPGQNAHGLDFIDQAARCGAVAVLCDQGDEAPTDATLPIIRVPCLADRQAELAKRLWGDPADGMELHAVTGTNGKSSVAWLLAQALDGAMIGTLGVGAPDRCRVGHLTTPDGLTLYRQLADLRAQGFDKVVLEASSHALDQKRLDGLEFASVIFTTLGHDHLDYHRTRQAYGKAKMRLFTDYPSQRQIINIDDSFGYSLADRCGQGPADLWTVSLHAAVSARVHAGILAERIDGLEVEIERIGQEDTVRAASNLVGRVNAYNLVIVAAELLARGHSGAEIGQRLAELRPVPGRMQVVPVSGGAWVVIDYAHTPDALDNALAALRPLCAGQLICVFGCGGERDTAKRPLMGRIAEALADRVILTDDNPRREDSMAILRAIQAGMRKPQRSRVIPDRAEAIARALDLAQAGDLVLIAGKGHECEQIIGDTALAFSDELTVRRWQEAAA